jgi:hypothetical protein
MIHYHGGPFVAKNPERVAVIAWTAKHACISFADPSQVAIAAEVSQSFFFDNGAFPIWRAGKGNVDIPAYVAWIEEWNRHPGFDFALIPDIIDGTERENDALIEGWTLDACSSVPVWHMHESVERLGSLCSEWPRVALGSSGQFADVGTDGWWNRMAQAMETACDSEGRPETKLHGLRMLDPTVFSHLPLSSADSTNVARNAGMDTKWTGRYAAITPETRAVVLAERIERHASAARWNSSGGIQQNLGLLG